MIKNIGRNLCQSVKICEYLCYGDDFVLNFKARKKNGTEITEVFSFNPTDLATTSPNGKTVIDKYYYFFAMFDEQLIYNAELYIDEGAGDYNGANQTEISNWVHFEDGESINSSVACSYGSKDTVSHFNTFMGQQNSLNNLAHTIQLIGTPNAFFRVDFILHDNWLAYRWEGDLAS